MSSGTPWYLEHFLETMLNSSGPHRFAFGYSVKVFFFFKGERLSELNGFVMDPGWISMLVDHQCAFSSNCVGSSTVWILNPACCRSSCCVLCCTLSATHVMKGFPETHHIRNIRQLLFLTFPPPPPPPPTLMHFLYPVLDVIYQLL